MLEASCRIDAGGAATLTLGTHSVIVQPNVDIDVAIRALVDQATGNASYRLMMSYVEAAAKAN